MAPHDSQSKAQAAWFTKPYILGPALPTSWLSPPKIYDLATSNLFPVLNAFVSSFSHKQFPVPGTFSQDSSFHLAIPFYLWSMNLIIFLSRKS